MATMAVGAASTMTAAIELLLGPLHLILYSSLLGTELYQSFVMTKVCFRALPKPAFRTLQKHVFPVYFRGQALLLLLTAATVPPVGPLSLVARKAHWIPFAVAGAMAALNLLVYGPRTQQAMVERAHQGAYGESLHLDPDPTPCPGALGPRRVARQVDKDR